MVTARDIIEALVDQEDRIAKLTEQVKVLEQAAVSHRMLVWELAQSQGIKQGEPYYTEDVIATAIKHAKERN